MKLKIKQKYLNKSLDTHVPSCYSIKGRNRPAEDSRCQRNSFTGIRGVSVSPTEEKSLDYEFESPCLFGREFLY